MLEKLGKKAIVAPFALVIVLTCVLSLAVAPLLQASPHDLSLAIVNLDEGVATPAGTVNAGAVLADKLTGEESEAAQESTAAMADALCWQAIGTEDELQDRFADNELFGGIVIPADFTAQQLAAKASGAKPQVTVYLNMGKNPQVASSLQAAMSQSLSAAGIDADIQMVNSAEVGGGMMAGLMAVQMMVMPLLVMTLSGSLILALLTWKRDIWGLKARSPWLAAAGQVGLIAALSACIAGCALAIDAWAGGLDLPCGQLFCWLWLGCACVMLSFVGLADACLPLGALFAVCVFALGMGTAMLPAEMLPTFWAGWVFPWAPQAHLGQGVRTIVYCGQTPAAADVTALLAFAGIGVAALLTAAGIAHSKRAKAVA